MKTTVDLPDDLMKRIKLRALNQGKNLKQTMVETLEAGLKVKPQTNGGGRKRRRVVITKDRKTGLPVIRCPRNAPARRMTTEQLLALEHETQTQEDLERLGLFIRQ